MLNSLNKKDIENLLPHRDSEKHYENIRKEILESGDARMIEALGLFPNESLVKLKKILNKITD